MQEFEYYAARTVQDAVAVLAREDGGARILAGGTDLLVQLREGRRKARLVLDIKHIPEANELSYDPSGGLRIGAAVPCYRIVDYARQLGIYPGLAMAVELVGGTQIQGRATIGGNLCNASPAADTIPALIVHRATCLVFGPGGYRQVAAEDFCIAPGQTVLSPGEFLVGVTLPPVPPGFGACYLRFTPRNEMDIAVVGAGAAVWLDESRSSFQSARVALAAVAPTPLFVREAGNYLAGRPASAETIQEAARIAQKTSRPIDDLRGTAAQRRHLSGVLARRALEAALARAREEE
jgi:CO/xanthine dehydrogenase FAD-binding subunit